MSIKHVLIALAQTPFVRGGSEVLADGLVEALAKRDLRTDVIKLPVKWHPKANILRNALAWRMLDLTDSNGITIDAVICFNFPSYAVKHPRKVIWLSHQHRQAYELFGTPFSDFSSSPEDQEIRAAIHTLDRRVIGETERRYAIAGNTARRLEKFIGLTATTLYPPPRHLEAYRCGPPGDYILSVGRLEKMKRVDLLIQALGRTRSAVRCLIAGKGPEEAGLRDQVRRLRLGDRVEFLGWVDDAALVDLYAGALAVYFAPFDEDYGYITVEAFLSGKPVLTAFDAGGPLEFVRDGENGLIRRADPTELAEAIDRVAGDPGWAAELGQAGRESVRQITWERTVDTLLSGL